MDPSQVTVTVVQTYLQSKAASWNVFVVLTHWRGNAGTCVQSCGVVALRALNKSWYRRAHCSILWLSHCSEVTFGCSMFTLMFCFVLRLLVTSDNPVPNFREAEEDCKVLQEARESTEGFQRDGDHEWTWWLRSEWSFRGASPFYRFSAM